MITPIYTTTKTAIVLKDGSAINVGTRYITGFVVDQRGAEAVRWAKEAIESLKLEIVKARKVKDLDRVKLLTDRSKKIQSEGIKTVKGRELLLLLAKAHPSVSLSPAERGTLIASFDNLSQEVVSGQ